MVFGVTTVSEVADDMVTAMSRKVMLNDNDERLLGGFNAPEAAPGSGAADFSAATILTCLVTLIS